MYQIDNSTAVASIPASTVAGTAGFFTDGNPATGVPATIMPAEFMNMLMMEILGVLSAAGVTPSKSTFTQLTTAIRAVNRQGSILVDTGAAGAYAAANTPALTSLPASGYIQRINIVNANIGASTYAPDGLAAKPIYGLGLQPLQGGELPVGIAVLMYLVQAGVNGGNGAWIIVESLGGAQQVSPATKSQHAVQATQVQAGFGSYALDGASVNVYAGNYTPAVTALTDGMPLRFKAQNANTGASTFSPNGLAAKAIVGLAGTALQGGEITSAGTCTVVYSLTLDKWVLTSCSGGALQVAQGTQSSHAIQLQQMGAVVGGFRNAKMSITVASATATFTADEVAVKASLGGTPWLLSSFSKTINLATTGAGGMDTGSAPVSGFVSLYVIYNPATGGSALLACAQATSNGSVYTGANMPAGYTASALISTWPTNASSQFVVGYQLDRKIYIDPFQVISSSTQHASLVSLSVALAVPTNAKTVDLLPSGTVSSSGFAFFAAGDSTGIGQRNYTVNSTGVQGVSVNDIPLITAQTIYYKIATFGTLTAFTLSVTSYTF